MSKNIFFLMFFFLKIKIRSRNILLFIQCINTINYKIISITNLHRDNEYKMLMSLNIYYLQN